MPAGKLKEKNMNKIFFFASLKSLKKGVGSGTEFGTGSVSKRYGSTPKCHGSPTLVERKIRNYSKDNDEDMSTYSA